MPYVNWKWIRRPLVPAIMPAIRAAGAMIEENSRRAALPARGSLAHCSGRRAAGWGEPQVALVGAALSAIS